MNLTMINSENMKKTKRKKSKTKINNYAGIEGVEKIVLPDDVQKLLMCEVGEQVSVQEPWAYVQKQTVMDNLLTTENSVFLPYKVELENYETDKILLGYIPDETDDIDEFYMCLTAESVIKTAAIAKKHRDEQRQKLQDIVCKTPGEWTSLGSDINTNKNNRALLEVLIETQYPIPKDKTKFRVHWAKAGDTSYTELLSTDNGDSILKKRIDNSVQVAPSHAHNEAQTVCTFPKNATANYQYNYDEIDPVLFQSKLDSYYVKHSLSFNNWLVINGLFNLYTLDYHVLAAKSILPPSRKKFHINEYMTYSDIQRCKGRMVEAVTWHPTMSWLFVVSYSTFSSYYYIRNEADDDEVFRAVHTLNPVLVWSVNDYLMPKLVLHSPREVMHLSFCPYDGNILIGGCKNGQVIIWDIRHELSNAENPNSMTQKQIYSFVNWTPHMTPVNIIQPIMISDLKHSHKSPIVGIRWRSPFHDFNETGKLVETCDGKISMQFETCGLDGTIFLWDMSQKPEILTASTIRRFKLKRKSSALKIVESPYKNLDLKPIYTVLLKRNERSLIVTHMTISKYSNLVYEGELDETRLRIEDKVTFKPVIHRLDHIEADMHIGTIKGEYAHIKWDGQEETEDEEIQPEPCKFINYGCYHDGPITQTAISDNGTVLTVGGSVFALWKDTFQFSPILWRKCNDYVCEGRWHSNNQARFNIVKNNGFVEHWMLHKDSYRCLDELVVNNGSIFVWKEHPRHFKNHVVGVGDEYGNFRLHNMEKMADNGKDVEDFGKFIDKEIAVRQNFKIWQSKWSDKHKSNEEAKRETKKVSIYRGESSKSIVSKPKLTPFELAKIQWDKDDKKRIKETVRNKTRLDITELKMLKEPYEVIQRDKQEKKQKLLSHAKKGDEILENTLETIFPQFMKTLKTNVEDPYAPGYTTDEKSECFNSFQNICHEAKTFIEENPYTYEFNMNDVIKKFKNRAKSLHEQDEEVHPHKLRLIEERKQKKIEEEQRRLAEEEERRRQEDLAEIERKKIKRKPKKSAKEKKPAEKVEATKAMKTEEIKNEKVDDKPAELKNN